MPIMPSTQSQSLISKVQRFLSGLWGKPPADGALEQIMCRSDFSCAYVLPERAKPIRITLKRGQ